MTDAFENMELIADIGGTNARFALADRSDALPRVLRAQTLRNAEFASLQHAAEHYLASVDVWPRRAAVAVASPMGADDIRLTNRGWSLNRDELRRALGLDELLLLNDFGAVASAVPSLGPDDYLHMYGPSTDPMRGPITVMGPGTGLGVALLVDPGKKGWQVVETEGGHVTFAPIGEEEQLISRRLTAQYGRASNERVLCGNGLSLIDAILRAGGCTDTSVVASPALRDPAEIVAAALQGHDLAARRSLARFCAVLGSVAGDAALIHGARTVLIAGGIVPRFLPFLRSSEFHARFVAKGRFSPHLRTVAVRVITHPNPGLLGAAVALRRATRGAAAP